MRFQVKERPKDFKHLNISLPEVSSEEVDDMRFYTAPDGKKYPSVTTILGDEDKEFFAGWRAKEIEEGRDPDIYSRRGEIVHFMVERYLNNEDPIYEDVKHVHKMLFSFVQPYLDKIDFIHMQEVPLISSLLKTGGRVDCIGTYEGVLSIIDFKNCKKLKEEFYIENYYKQATLYSLMYKELTGIEINNIVIIMSALDGSGGVYKANTKDYLGKTMVTMSKFYKNHKELFNGKC